jgi:hypothetical protein
MSGNEMAQPALHAITGDGISKRSTHNEPDAWSPPLSSTSLGRNIVSDLHGVDDQRGPTHSNPPPGRPPEILRVVHSQQSR